MVVNSILLLEMPAFLHVALQFCFSTTDSLSSDSEVRAMISFSVACIAGLFRLLETCNAFYFVCDSALTEMVSEFVQPIAHFIFLF